MESVSAAKRKELIEASFSYEGPREGLARPIKFSELPRAVQANAKRARAAAIGQEARPLTFEGYFEVLGSPQNKSPVAFAAFAAHRQVNYTHGRYIGFTESEVIPFEKLVGD